MKNNRFITAAFALCLLISPMAAHGEERANPLAGEEFTAESYVKDALEAANKGVEVVFPYTSDNVYQIYLQQGFLTDIRLEPNETLKYVGAGDTTRWVIDTSSTGPTGSKTTHIFIKPTQQGISTNLVINTSKRIYQLLLISGNSFNPVVSWSFPKNSRQLHNEQVTKTYSTINPRNLEFTFNISNKKYKWSPAVVFSTANKTYMRMKEDIVNSELPAFFVLDDDNKMTLVSYRFVKGYMVVDRLFDKGILLLGDKKVVISKRG